MDTYKSIAPSSTTNVVKHIKFEDDYSPIFEKSLEISPNDPERMLANKLQIKHGEQSNIKLGE